jgi:hypothetical protein
MPSAISQSKEMKSALDEVFIATNAEQMKEAIGKVSAALSNTKLGAKQFAGVLKEVNPERFKQLESNIKKTSKAEDELKRKQK